MLVSETGSEHYQDMLPYNFLSVQNRENLQEDFNCNFKVLKCFCFAQFFNVKQVLSWEMTNHNA